MELPPPPPPPPLIALPPPEEVEVEPGVEELAAVLQESAANRRRRSLSSPEKHSIFNKSGRLCSYNELDGFVLKGTAFRDGFCLKKNLNESPMAARVMATITLLGVWFNKSTNEKVPSKNLYFRPQNARSWGRITNTSKVFLLAISGVVVGILADLPPKLSLKFVG